MYERRLVLCQPNPKKSSASTICPAQGGAAWRSSCRCWPSWGCSRWPCPPCCCPPIPGGWASPPRLDCEAYGHAALAHYRELGLAFDCIYTGYLGSEALVDLAAEAFRLWPDALKVVDPVMADGGRPYSGFAPSVIDKVRDLCRQASLILPNLTEARLLLGPGPRPARRHLGRRSPGPGRPADRPGRAGGGHRAAHGQVRGLRRGGRRALCGPPPPHRPQFPRHGGPVRGHRDGGRCCGATSLAPPPTRPPALWPRLSSRPPRTADTRFGVWFEPLLPRLAPMPEF